MVQAINQEAAPLIKQAKFYPGIKEILLSLKKTICIGYSQFESIKQH
jgi:hypothetical protein